MGSRGVRSRWRARRTRTWTPGPVRVQSDEDDDEETLSPSADLGRTSSIGRLLGTQGRTVSQTPSTPWDRQAAVRLTPRLARAPARPAGPRLPYVLAPGDLAAAAAAPVQ